MRGALSLAIFLGIGLAAGLAIATFRSSDMGSVRYSDAGAGGPLAERLGDLERRLAREVEARVRLGEEIELLREQLAAAPSAEVSREGLANLMPAFGTRTETLREGDREGETTPEALLERVQSFRNESRRRPTPEEQEQRRIERMVAAGFTPDRAQWIERRSAELQLELMQAEYEARRSGEPLARRSVDEALRAELGDAEYERYLEGTGRPTRVAVVDVLAGSPGERAGLRLGDEVLSYGGQRVFEPQDLTRFTLEGTPGEMVAVDIVRDGVEMQVYVPRGPIGITNRASRGGRRGPPGR